MIDIIKNKKTYHIDYVCVDPEYRGQKIGKTMMDYVIDYAKKEGGSRIELTSNPTRVAAHKLYENCGFLPVGLRPKYYDGVDALLMSKDI